MRNALVPLHKVQYSLPYTWWMEGPTLLRQLGAGSWPQASSWTKRKAAVRADTAFTTKETCNEEKIAFNIHCLKWQFMYILCFKQKQHKYVPGHGGHAKAARQPCSLACRYDNPMPELTYHPPVRDPSIWIRLLVYTEYTILPTAHKFT